VPLPNATPDLGEYLGLKIEDNRDGSPRILRYVKSVEQFVRVVQYVYNIAPHVIYRGQRRDLPLVPSIGRKSPQSQWLAGERDALEEFKREAIPYLSFVPANDWQWLAVAQHNRLPTRMLDWTKSSIAALWFALAESIDTAEDAVIWAYSYEANEAVTSSQGLESPFLIDRVRPYLPEHIFPSIQAQSSVLTIHPTKESQFTPFEDTKDVLLSKILVSADSVPSMRLFLTRLGVNHALLYPGIAGIVGKLRYQYEIPRDERLLP
jgi:hypothetical protein